MRAILASTLAVALAAGCATRVAERASGPESPLGRYESPDGRVLLVTPGAWGGLTLADLDAQTAGRLVPLGAGSFRWESVTGRFERRVTAIREDGRVVALEVSDGAGYAVRGVRRSPPAYRQAEVAFDSDGVRLAGTLFLPEGETVAGVAMIHGAGTSHRDNGWYLTVVDRLARSGIAVLLPDKRGAGQSAGDWREVGFDALAGDALAAVRRLAEEPGVPGDRVGVLSLSQGGSVAPIAAAGSEDVAFVVSVSGAVFPLWRQQLHYLAAAAEDAGFSPAVRDSLLDLYRSALAFMRTGAGWEEYVEVRAGVAAGPAAALAGAVPADSTHWSFDWGRKVVDVDPVEWWRRVDVPVLAVFGSDDVQVPVEESVRRLREVLPSATVRVFEASGHGIEPPDDPRPREAFLDLVARWIQEAVGSGG